MLHELNHALFG